MPKGEKYLNLFFVNMFTELLRKRETEGYSQKGKKCKTTHKCIITHLQHDTLIYGLGKVRQMVSLFIASSLVPLSYYIRSFLKHEGHLIRLSEV